MWNKIVALFSTANWSCELTSGLSANEHLSQLELDFDNEQEVLIFEFDMEREMLVEHWTEPAGTG